MNKKFTGTYYKHQKDDRTLSLVVGTAGDHAFIQVITNDRSFYIRYPLSAYESGEPYRIGRSIFSNDGIEVHIEEEDITMHGTVVYLETTPLRYDIMGPFRFLPMQCRHRIQSLHHRLEGTLTVNGEPIDFTGGVGYIEGDSGRSFPRRYVWIQCNDFTPKACVTASVADIPFFGLYFRGCICVVYCRNKEYRLATYLGASIYRCDGNQMIIRQGKLQLEIEVGAGANHPLLAPEKGAMIREIRERIVCSATFRLVKAGKVLFEQRSDHASFEIVNSSEFTGA